MTCVTFEAGTLFDILDERKWYCLILDFGLSIFENPTGIFLYFFTMSVVYNFYTGSVIQMYVIFFTRSFIKLAK